MSSASSLHSSHHLATVRQPLLQSVNPSPSRPRIAALTHVHGVQLPFKKIAPLLSKGDSPSSSAVDGVEEGGDRVMVYPRV